MKLKDFDKIRDKTIPTDLDSDYDADLESGKVLFNEEIELTGQTENRYLDNRVRLIIVQSEYLYYAGEKIKDDSVFTVYLYAYDKDDGYGAFTFDGSIDEITELGGIDDFIYEVVTNKKGLFSDRGSSVCTGDMPEKDMVMSL